LRFETHIQHRLPPPVLRGRAKCLIEDDRALVESGCRLQVTCPKGHFVRNGVVQIPKFDANPNPNPNPNPDPNLTLTLTLCLYVSDK